MVQQLNHPRLVAKINLNNENVNAYILLDFCFNCSIAIFGLNRNEKDDYDTNRKD